MIHVTGKTSDIVETLVSLAERFLRGVSQIQETVVILNFVVKFTENTRHVHHLLVLRQEVHCLSGFYRHPLPTSNKTGSAEHKEMT